MIGSRREKYLESLPIFSSQHPPTDAQCNTVTLGFLSLLPIYNSLSEGKFPPNVVLIVLVESSARDFLISLSVLDFQKFVESCRTNNIGIELIVDDDVVPFDSSSKPLLLITL